MRRETKIGLLTIISIGILIYGFKFLQGINVFSNDIVIHAQYEEVATILPSNPVYHKGFQVGIVAAVRQNPESRDGFILDINVAHDIKLPVTTVAVIKSELTGGRFVELEYPEGGMGKDFLEDGDYVEGRTDGVVPSLITQDELSAYLQIVKDSIMAMTQGASDELNLKETKAAVDRIVNNVDVLTASMASMLKAQNSNLNQAIVNTKNLTATANEEIAKLSNRIDSLLMTVNQPDGLLENTNERMKDIEGTLVSLDSTMVNLNQVLAKVNNGEGTLGKLVNEDSTYNQLNASLKELELLLEDFRVHPKRYTRVLSKKEIPYEENK